MRSIDNVQHAIGQARDEQLDLSHLVVTAWRRPELLAIGFAVARALGANKEELTVDDLIKDAIVGTVIELVHTYSRDKRHLMDDEDLGKIEDEYLALIAKASGTQSEAFLRQARRRIHAALNLSLIARLDGVTLGERYARTPIAAAISFVIEVDQYLRDYKQQCGMIDTADLLLGELEPIEDCTLLLFSPTGMPPLALQALRRLLPKAFFCSVRD